MLLCMLGTQQSDDDDNHIDDDDDDIDDDADADNNDNNNDDDDNENHTDHGLHNVVLIYISTWARTWLADMPKACDRKSTS